MQSYNIVLSQAGYRTGPKHLNNWYLPYAIGCLWAYAIHDSKIESNFKVIDWVWKRNDINSMISSWTKVDILFCSVYVWNDNYTSELCKAVKEKWPDCLIVWGGPQCDHTNDKIFQSKFFVDIVVVSEGEQTFKEICHRIMTNDRLDDIQGTIFNQDLHVKRNPLRPRSELDNYPSPYISGVFDELIDKTPGVSWSATLETNRGCPYSCTFCDWGSLIASKVKKFKLEKVFAEIEWFRKKKINWIMIADANFGIFKERDIQIAKLLNDLYETSGHLAGVTFAFLKNKTDVIIEIARIVKFLMGNGITLSVQSLDPHTLKNIKRDNMEINDISKLISKMNKEKIPYYTEMIIGLPGETLESWKNNYWKLYDAGFHKGINVWQLAASINSELSQTQVEKHQMVTKKIPVIDEDNNIAEHIPSVIATDTLPFADYVKAWMFSKIQNFLHGIGFSLDASIRCKQEGIDFYKFYDQLEKQLWKKSSWRSMINQMEHLFVKLFHEEGQTISERQIDIFGLKQVFLQRENLFQCVDKTLEHFKIEEKNNIIQHAKALVFDPIHPYNWPLTVDDKTYEYKGPKFQNLDQYAELQTYRRNSIFVEISE